MKHLNHSEYFPQICLNSNVVVTGVYLYHDMKNKLKVQTQFVFGQEGDV